VAADPQTMPTDFCCESARLLESTPTIAIYYYTVSQKYGPQQFIGDNFTNSQYLLIIFGKKTIQFSDDYGKKGFHNNSSNLTQMKHVPV